MVVCLADELKPFLLPTQNYASSEGLAGYFADDGRSQCHAVRPPGHLRTRSVTKILRRESCFQSLGNQIAGLKPSPFTIKLTAASDYSARSENWVIHNDRADLCIHVHLIVLIFRPQASPMLRLQPAIIR